MTDIELFAGKGADDRSSGQECPVLLKIPEHPHVVVAGKKVMVKPRSRSSASFPTNANSLSEQPSRYRTSSRTDRPPGRGVRHIGDLVQPAYDLFFLSGLLVAPATPAKIIRREIDLLHTPWSGEDTMDQRVFPDHPTKRSSASITWPQWGTGPHLRTVVIFLNRGRKSFDILQEIGSCSLWLQASQNQSRPSVSSSGACIR